MGTSGFNPFHQQAGQQLPKAPALGVQYNAANGNMAACPMGTPGMTLPGFQMAGGNGQELFASNVLNFQPQGFPGANAQSPMMSQGEAGFRNSLLSLQNVLSGFQQFVPQQGAMPVNIPEGNTAPQKQTTASAQPAPTSQPVPQTAGNLQRKVVVLDTGEHGKVVNGITADRVGQNNIINIDDPMPTAKYTGLNDFIETGLSTALNDKAKDINGIVQKYGSQVGTINFSSGFNKLQLIDTISTMMDKEDIRANVLSSLNLPQNADEASVINALTVRVENISNTSTKFKEAKGNYQKAVNTASSKNIALVTAAGNDNNLYNKFSQYTDLSKHNDIATNVYSMANGVITVGAVDNKGTADYSDDTNATFASRTDKVTVAMNGVNVGVSDANGGFSGENGTSFSAPQVASLIAKMQKQNPNLSVAQITEALQQSAKQNTVNAGNTAVTNRVVGAGIVDTQGALNYAQQHFS